MAKKKVIKRCSKGHLMEALWKRCPKCTGGKPGQKTGRSVVEATVFGQADDLEANATVIVSPSVSRTGPGASRVGRPAPVAPPPAARPTPPAAPPPPATHPAWAGPPASPSAPPPVAHPAWAGPPAAPPSAAPPPPVAHPAWAGPPATPAAPTPPAPAAHPAWAGPPAMPVASPPAPVATPPAPPPAPTPPPPPPIATPAPAPAEVAPADREVAAPSPAPDELSPAVPGVAAEDGTQAPPFSPALSKDLPVRSRAKLECTGGPLHGRMFMLATGIYRIGKAPRTLPDSKPIVVAGDRWMSKDHAVLVVDSGQIVLTDPGSTNGSFVNGEKTARTVLKSGDELRLGESTFKFTMLGS